MRVCYRKWHRDDQYWCGMQSFLTFHFLTKYPLFMIYAVQQGRLHHVLSSHILSHLVRKYFLITSASILSQNSTFFTFILHKEDKFFPCVKWNKQFWVRITADFFDMIYSQCSQFPQQMSESNSHYVHCHHKISFFWWYSGWKSISSKSIS